ncbi:helix-turn-helix domain-containing protein [Vibrio cholerae]
MTVDVNETLNALRSEIAEMKQLLAQFVENTVSDGSKSNKEYFTVDEAAAYVGAKRSYIYRLTHEKRLSFTKPGGNRVLIKRSDLQAWLEKNRVKSADELHQDVANYITSFPRGRKAS